MPLVILNHDKLNDTRLKIDQLFESGKISEPKRNKLMSAVKSLPESVNNGVHFESDDAYFINNDEVDLLVDNRILETFKWVTDDVEYDLGMCNSPIEAIAFAMQIEAIDFASQCEDLYKKWYIVNLRKITRNSMPSTEFDLVAGYWGDYVFNIVIIGDV